MKKISLVAVVFFLCLRLQAQSDSVQLQLVLVGDAGSLATGQTVLEAVKNTIDFTKNTRLLFLGDNIYPSGLPDELNKDFKRAKAIIDAQIHIADGSPTPVYIMPGNHDWNDGEPGGWQAIKRQQVYVDSSAGTNVQFFPKNGCPGPVEISLSADAVLVLFDTQWWLHPYDKPGIESDCANKTRDDVLEDLKSILARNQKKLVVFASHHPFKSIGIHGGYYTLKQHIFPLTDINPYLYFPLPVVGSIYPVARGVFGTPQDLKHPVYASMIAEVQKVVAEHRNVIFVAGHEHNLQLLQDSNFHYIISGSGSNVTRVSRGEQAQFVAESRGFAVLQLTKSKLAKIEFYTVSDSIRKAYSAVIADYSRPLLPQLRDTIPEVYVANSADSIEVAANSAYAKASNFKRFLNGDNYRNVWAEPVKLKIFRIRNEMGGLTPGRLGGGNETRSLRLTDKKGKEYTLRTVNKNIRKVLPPGVRGSAAEDYLQDLISAAHPYAPLVIPPLAEAAKVVVAHPQIFFVPNDPALGIYRPYFANSICLLEEREPTPNGEDTKSKQSLFNDLVNDNDDRVDQKAYLRARLLDFLIADWDRHANQWRFGKLDTGKGKLYYPIPRDRDQAFSFSDGFLVNVAAQNFLPFLRGFKQNIRGIKWLAYWAKDMDRALLNRLDENDWRTTLSNFTRQLNDKLIDSAVRRLPPEIYPLSSQPFTSKLKSRRDVLPEAAMSYYQFISKKVDITGSNKSERFRVSSIGKRLQVRVYKKVGSDTTAIMYDRIFDPSVTKEIVLYGLNGNDYFEIDRAAKSRIKIRAIGGRGQDTFNMQGRVKNYLYDQNGGNNKVLAERRSRKIFSNDPAVNNYSADGFNYNTYSFPIIDFGYNAEDGLMAGIGFSRRTYAFRKEPFSTDQRLSTLYAFSSGAFKFFYQGIFNSVVKKNDLVIGAEMAKPALNNFFGIGNYTKVSTNREVTYYRVRYNYFDANLLLRRRLNRIVHVYTGPRFFYYWNHLKDNQNKILSAPSFVGLDSTRIYQPKTYAGAKAAIQINNVNSEFLPTRGVLWTTEFSALGGLNKNSKPLTTLSSDMTLYSSLRDPAKVVSVIKLGAGHIFSRHYEYFQAMNLGQNNYLRGFRKNRFSGSGMAYGSLSLLVKMFESKSYIFPGAVGLLVFNDVGRVWTVNQNSKKWHYTAGGGFYYTPFNLLLLSATAGYSEEELLINLTLGTKFNLTF